MRTTRKDVLCSLKSARQSSSTEHKVDSIRYFLESDGTFQLPRDVIVEENEYEDPDVLIDRLIKVLEVGAEREASDIAESQSHQ